jgi:hypothetical protein
MITTKVKNGKEKKGRSREQNRPVPIGCLPIVFFYHLIDRQIDIDKSLVDIRIRLELL